MVVRNACLAWGPNRAQGLPGVNGERDMDRVFLVEFADDLITVDERCIGGGGLAHTSKFAAIMALKIVVCILAVIVLRMSSASGW